ncbi:MAG: hypothetical protein DMF75_16640, partial [Acidobacteria bacterium]
DGQVEQGINEALARVEADGVIVEGNSFLECVKADLAIMCARAEGGKIKSSARRALASSDFLYLSTLGVTAVPAKRQFELFCAALTIELDFGGLPIVTREDFPLLLSRIFRREKFAEPVAAFTGPVIVTSD